MSDFRPGDILGFSGKGLTSNVIKAFTCSRYSHVGGIAPYAGEMLLFESTTLSDLPCVITGEHVKGVQAQYPNRRIAAYEGSVWRLRLVPDWVLSSDETELLTRYLVAKIGIDYSAAEAALAGGNLIKRWICRRESFHHAFCSQLWTGALERVGRHPPVNAGKVNPGQLIRTLVDLGYYQPPERLK